MPVWRCATAWRCAAMCAHLASPYADAKGNQHRKCRPRGQCTGGGLSERLGVSQRSPAGVGPSADLLLVGVEARGQHVREYVGLEVGVARVSQQHALEATGRREERLRGRREQMVERRWEERLRGKQQQGWRVAGSKQQKVEGR
eukprot:6304418-Prymnesium_polylepis.1